MFTLKNYDLSDVNTSSHSLNHLFEIFKCTLNPDLTEREFNSYLFGCHPDSLEMSFIYTNNELAGFCTSAAYPRKINGKKTVILRSAFGMLDKYKKGGFPLQGLFFKYIKYKLRHLFTPVYVTGFMANPLMYSMICKYTLTCYPRRNKTPTVDMLAFKEGLLSAMKLTRKEISPFVLKVHFQVRFKECDKLRFESSQNQDVKYFLSINPGYCNQIGVLVIIPVTIPNMTYTFLKFIFRMISKKFRSIRKRDR